MRTVPTTATRPLEWPTAPPDSLHSAHLALDSFLRRKALLQYVVLLPTCGLWRHIPLGIASGPRIAFDLDMYRRHAASIIHSQALAIPRESAAGKWQVHG